MDETKPNNPTHIQQRAENHKLNMEIDDMRGPEWEAKSLCFVSNKPEPKLDNTAPPPNWYCEDTVCKLHHDYKMAEPWSQVSVASLLYAFVGSGAAPSIFISTNVLIIVIL